MGFFSLLAIALIVLKLMGYITIGWLAIAGICIGIPTLIYFGLIMLAGTSAHFQARKRRERIRKDMAETAAKFKKDR